MQLCRKKFQKLCILLAKNRISCVCRQRQEKSTQGKNLDRSKIFAIKCQLIQYQFIAEEAPTDSHIIKIDINTICLFMIFIIGWNFCFNPQ